MNKPRLLSTAIVSLGLAPAVHAHSGAEVGSGIALLTHMLTSADHMASIGLIVLAGLGMALVVRGSRRDST